MMVLVGCSRHGDAEVRKNLPGTWIVDGTNSADSFESHWAIDVNGDYVCRIVFQNSEDAISRTQDMRGKVEVRDGVLIDTMTWHSSTNARLPMISRSRIVRQNRSELVLSQETNSRGEFLTNGEVIVFRKEIK